MHAEARKQREKMEDALREAFAHSTPGRLHGLPHRAAMTGEKRRMRCAQSRGVNRRAAQGLCAANLVAAVAATSTITDPKLKSVNC